MEARKRSGSLITVDLALEQGKDVFAVPGRLTDPLSEGCNHLIQQGGVSLHISVRYIGIFGDGWVQKTKISEKKRKGTCQEGKNVV